MKTFKDLYDLLAGASFEGGDYVNRNHSSAEVSMSYPSMKVHIRIFRKGKEVLSCKIIPQYHLGAMQSSNITGGTAVVNSQLYTIFNKHFSIDSELAVVIPRDLMWDIREIHDLLYRWSNDNSEESDDFELDADSNIDADVHGEISAKIARFLDDLGYEYGASTVRDVIRVKNSEMKQEDSEMANGYPVMTQMVGHMLNNSHEIRDSLYSIQKNTKRSRRITSEILERNKAFYYATNNLMVDYGSSIIKLLTDINNKLHDMPPLLRKSLFDGINPNECFEKFFTDIPPVDESFRDKQKATKPQPKTTTKPGKKKVTKGKTLQSVEDPNVTCTLTPELRSLLAGAPECDIHG